MEYRRWVAVRLTLCLSCVALIMGGQCAAPQPGKNQEPANRSDAAHQIEADQHPPANQPSGSRATELMQMNTMNAKFIAGLARMLMDDAFSVADMERYLGSVVDDSNPEHVRLKSRLEDLAELTISWDQKIDPVFVHTIYATYEKPVKLDTAMLQKEFGDANELPRLKPDQPRPFMIELKGKRYSGNLLLNVDGANWRRDPIVRIRLMRYYPE